MLRRTGLGLLTGLLLSTTASPAVGAATAGNAAAVVEPRGSGSYFFCAMGQTVKYIGLFSGNVPLTLAGAIGGGIACGMGW